MYVLDTNTVIYYFKGMGQVAKPIGPFDGLIAGTALAEKATLVTHNTREFGRVGGLSLVDWYLGEQVNGAE
jgi:predicted nucleic acid-binding protein